MTIAVMIMVLLLLLVRIFLSGLKSTRSKDLFALCFP